MPWYRESMKDVISCEKPREGANNHRSVDIRMGQPVRSQALTLRDCNGLAERTRGTETSKYPEEEKAKAISSVAASERETA